MDVENLDLKTEVNGWVVSTVRLSCDHGWGDIPMWYETMIYRHVDTLIGLDFQDFQTRYHSVEEAKMGHDKTVQAVAVMSDGIAHGG